MIVVKYGGSALEDSGLDDLLRELTGMDAVLVHGGGPEISRLCKQLGVESSFVDGLRVTDAATLDAAQMVLCGRVNKLLVARLGARAVGLSGVDGGMLQCEPLDARLGSVGRILAVEPAVIRCLLAGGFLPVVAPIGVGARGERYNLNADTAAAALARALGAERLIYLTDVPGVLHKGRLLPQLSVSEMHALIASGEITGGMIPKVKACEEAGVPAQIVRAGTPLAHALAGSAGTVIAA